MTMSLIGIETISNSSSKTLNTLYKLRTRSSNIIHHPKGRSELRDAFMCESKYKDMIVVKNNMELRKLINQ